MIKAKTDFPFSWATAPKPVPGRENEDVCFTLKAKGGVAAAVLDGMGGTPDGDKASRIAASILFHNVNLMDFRCSPDEIAVHLQFSLQLADRHLKQMAEAGHLNKGAGTTAVVSVVLQPASSKSLECDVLVAYAGDSRAYLYRPDGGLDCLTVDNDAGLILKGLDMIRFRMARTHQVFLSGVSDQAQMDTPERCQAFALRNIIDVGLFAGQEYLTPQYPVSVIRAPLGSRIILCSDGLSDPLTDLEIRGILEHSQPLEGALALLQAAKDRATEEHLRRKADDITVVEIVIDRPSGRNEL